MDVSPQQLVLYETARALVECQTLEEAAPRVVAAVCNALGWQFGAIWQADRARKIQLPRSVPPDSVVHGEVY